MSRAIEVRLEDIQLEKLKLISKQNKISINSLIRQAVRKLLQDINY